VNNKILERYQSLIKKGLYQGETELHHQAYLGNIKILEDCNVDKVFDSHDHTPLHTLAFLAIPEVLNHPSVNKVKNKKWVTPFMLLAYRGVVEILKHPAVGKFCYFGETPLHILAQKGKVEILEHPLVDKIRNRENLTPLHVLVIEGKVSRKMLKKKYPWFKIKFWKKITHKTIDEILNTYNAERFIGEI